MNHYSMNFVILGLIYVVVLFIQLTFSNLLEIYEIKPDFVLIFLIYISLKYGRVVGTISGFFMGIIEDSLMSVLFGLNALCKTFAGFLVCLIPWRFAGTSTINVGFLIFIVAFIHDFLYNLLYSFGSGMGIFFILFRYAMPGAIYTAIIGMMINALFPGYLKLKYEQS